MEARREGASWLARIRGPGGERTVRARALVNATGPWVEELFGRIAGALPRQTVRLVKGSHVVMPKLYPGEHAFILQNPDRRMVFAIPFEESFTLVGTTEVEWRGPAGAAEISEEEIDYLLETIRRNFFAEVSRGDIVWTYSGVRALCDDGARNASNVTRDYRLDLDGSRPEAPLLSVFGGKITTYRRLAEQAVDRIASMLSWPGMSWTKEALLPGGDIPDLEPDAYARELTINYPALPPRLLTRLAGTYGTRATRVLDDVRNAEDLGEHFGCGLYAREVDYLVGQEWARTPEDILFRRTKLGLHMGREGVDRLEAHLAGSA
jgi:glycerol-3-phosphate dehydrogenase